MQVKRHAQPEEALRLERGHFPPLAAVRQSGQVVANSDVLPLRMDALGAREAPVGAQRPDQKWRDSGPEADPWLLQWCA